MAVFHILGGKIRRKCSESTTFTFLRIHGYVFQCQVRNTTIFDISKESHIRIIIFRRDGDISYGIIVPFKIPVKFTYRNPIMTAQVNII